MAILIRQARAGELDEVLRVLRAAFEQFRPVQESSGAFDDYLLDVTNVRARLDEADLFVAVDSECVIGTATLYRPKQTVVYPTRVAYKPWPSEWASLRLLAVDPAYRGRGVGRMLAEARVGRARELGAPVVGLHTSQAFQVARGMYRRMGWRRVPEYDYFPIPGIVAEAYALDLG